nr:copia protein [Tanacetum cinerariifolium]
MPHDFGSKCTCGGRVKVLVLFWCTEAFADADHAGCQDTRRSTSGSLQFLGDRLISWSSKRQKSAAISSTEAEYIALSKHIDIRYHFIKEHVENGVIKLYFVNTEYQLADIFTKALGRERIEFLINKLGMRGFTSKTLKRLTDEVDETMDMTIDQQVALDEALVPHASRLTIGKSNFHLRSDITSKESTLQVVYDVLRLTLFYKAFLVTADVPEICMQEFWASATVHQHSIRFKMNNKKRIVNLEYFREMLHIYLRINNQTFDELPFEEEILAFLRYLGHSGEIKNITDGMYHKKNVDFAYLLWEDFVYQVKHKDAKKSNEMYYPRFTKVIINFFMTKDLSIPRRNKNTEHFGAMLPVDLTNEGIRNSATYKEYYAIASGAAPPKTKASVRKTQSSSDTTMPPPTVACTRLLTLKKGNNLLSHLKQKVYLCFLSGFGTDEGTGITPGVPDVPTDESDEEISWKSSDEDDDNDDDQDSDNDDDDFVHPNNDDESHGMNVGGDEGPDAEDDDEELYRDVNINLEGQDVQMTDAHTTQSSFVSSQFVTSMLNPSPDTGIDYLFELTHRVDVPVTTTVVPLLVTVPTLPPPSIPIISQSILDTYGDTVTLKRRRDDEDQDEEPSAGSDRGSKRRRASKEPELTSALKEKASKTFGKSTEGSKSHQKTASESVPAEEPMQTTQYLEEPLHQEFKTGVGDDVAEASQHPKWFQKQTKPQTPNRAWNKTLPATHESIQPWISDLAKQIDSHTSFNELMDTPMDFSAFLMNRLKVDTLTPELLAGLTYELIKGSCKSLQYPHNLLKPLPPIPNSQGRRAIPFDHFINNDLEYQRGGASSRKYTTSVTKTKAADYGHIKWIEDLVPRTMWSQAPVNYDKMLSEESPIGGVNVNSSMDLWPTVSLLEMSTPNVESSDDDKLYKFKEGNLKRLRIQDIKDMLLLLVQGKLTNHCVESYQKKLNLTKPDTYRSEAYTTYSNPRGFIYQNKDKQNRLMRIDELYKFNNDTLNDVRTALDDHLRGIQMKYLPQTI